MMDDKSIEAPVSQDQGKQIEKADQLKPTAAKLDKELQDKIAALYAESKAMRDEDELNNRVEERFDTAARNFGFISHKEFTETVTPRLEEMANEITRLREQLAEMRHISGQRSEER